MALVDRESRRREEGRVKRIEIEIGSEREGEEEDGRDDGMMRAGKRSQDESGKRDGEWRKTDEAEGEEKKKKRGRKRREREREREGGRKKGTNQSGLDPVGLNPSTASSIDWY